MDVGRLTSTNTRVSARRNARMACNRRADYLGRIAAATGDPRLQIAHAADAVRAAGKDLGADQAQLVVAALLGLAGLSDNEEVNAAAARLLEAAGRQAAHEEGKV